MTERNLRVLLAEGSSGEAAESLRALFPKGQPRLDLTVVSTISTLIPINVAPVLYARFGNRSHCRRSRIHPRDGAANFTQPRIPCSFRVRRPGSSPALRERGTRSRHSRRPHAQAGGDTAAKLPALFGSLPILFTRGYLQDSNSVAPAAIDAHYLQKPYSPITLGRIVREILDEAKSRAEVL